MKHHCGKQLSRQEQTTSKHNSLLSFRGGLLLWRLRSASRAEPLYGFQSARIFTKGTRSMWLSRVSEAVEAVLSFTQAPAGIKSDLLAIL
jgi:hypothetical protein